MSSLDGHGGGANKLFTVQVDRGGHSIASLVSVGAWTRGFNFNCDGNTLGTCLTPMHSVPAWKDEQFLALLKQGLLTLRKEQLQRTYKGASALPIRSSAALPRALQD